MLHLKENKGNSSSGKSMAMLITSMLAFGTIGIFRRSIPLDSGVIAFFRGIIGALFLMIWVKVQGKKLFHGIGRKTFLLLALSGAVIGFNWILLFEAYNYTTVSIATLCYYMQPILVILASAFLFRERITWRKGVCTLLSLTGMVFISGILEGGIAGISWRGIACGLGAAALYATVVLLNKAIRGVDAYEKTTIQLACAGLVMIPYLLWTGGFANLTMDGRTMLLLALVSIVHTGICYALYFGSMDGLRTQTVAIFSYIDPITALILSAVFLGEKLTIFGLIGAVLILGSAIWSEWNLDA